MRDLVILMLLSALGAPPHSAAERIIQLKDGGTLLVRTDGNMVHRDASGRRVPMRDGEPMETWDGSRQVMQNDPAWRQIIEKRSLSPMS